MGAPLLGGQTTLTYTVKNTSANNIRRGTVVYADPAASVDKIGETYVLPCQNFSGTDIPIGIAVSPIAAGDYGLVMAVGPCLVETNGSVATGNGCEIATDGGTPAMGQFVPNTTGTNYGYAINTDENEWIDVDFDGGVTRTYALCLVSFLGVDTTVWG